LAEKLEAEAGRRGLERPRTVQRIIVEEGNEAAELAKVTNADHVIMRVIVKAARPDPAPDVLVEDLPCPRRNDKLEEETQPF